MNDINSALEKSRKPGQVICPLCDDKLFSPMDKLSIGLFDKCSACMDEDSIEMQNLLKISNEIWQKKNKEQANRTIKKKKSGIYY